MLDGDGSETITAIGVLILHNGILFVDLFLLVELSRDFANDAYKILPNWLVSAIWALAGVFAYFAALVWVFTVRIMVGLLTNE